MLQLDLFGSFLDTAVEEKPGEKQAAAKKVEERTSPVIKTEEISYSLVEIAEEVLKAAPSARSDEIIRTNELDKKQTEQGKDFSFSTGEINKQTRSTLTVIEKLELVSETSSPVNNNIDDDKKTDDKTLTEANIPEKRPGLIIFEDGKITVKVKNKHLSADPGLSVAENRLTPSNNDSVLPVINKPIVADAPEKEKKEPQKRGRKSLQEIEAEADLIEVPDDEVLFQKQYYTISEVAKWFRVNTSLLRFWENEFDILKPKKNRKGDRLFRPEDVKNLQLIYQLLRQRKYTIEGAKEYIKTNRKKADIQLQLTNTLKKFKSFLLDLKSNLQT